MNIAIFTIYLVVVLSVAYYFRKDSVSTKGYLQGNHSLDTISIAFSSVSSVVSSAGILFAFAIAFTTGLAGYGIHIAFASSFLIASIFVGRFYKLALEHDILTLSDYIFERVGRFSGKLFAIVSIIFMFGTAIGLFSINIDLLERYLYLSPSIATIVSFAIVILYIVIGGFNSVVKTDVLQFGATLIFIALIFYFTPKSVSFSETVNLGEWFGSGFWLVAPAFFFTNIINPALWQPVLGARNAAVATRGVLIAGLLVAFSLLPIVYLSYSFIELMPSADPNTYVLNGISSVLPAFIIPLVFMTLYASLMSTLDTALFYCSSNIAKNLLPKRMIDKIGLVRMVKYLVVMISLVTIFLSGAIPGFLEFIVKLYPVAGIAAIPFFLSLYFKLNDKVTATAMAVGIAFFVYLFIFPPELFVYMAVPSIVSGLICGLSLIFGKSKNQIA